MIKTSQIPIVKASGEVVLFNPEKLLKSLERAGASPVLAEEIADRVSQKLYEGITTRQIYDIAHRQLRKSSRKTAGKYHLKQGIMELGPQGYMFERLIAELMRSESYEAQSGVTMEGRCVTHEVDVVARKGEMVQLMECKYHNQRGFTCDVKVPLYIHSRFLDLMEAKKDDYGEKAAEYSAWVVTNTRFTLDAIRYGECAGLKMLGWDYPEGNALRDRIEKNGVYPVTCLTTLSSTDKKKLLELGILLCRDLIERPEMLEFLGHTIQKNKRIIDEALEIRRSI